MKIRQTAQALIDATDDHGPNPKSFYDVTPEWETLGNKAQNIVQLCDSHDTLVNLLEKAARFVSGPTPNVSNGVVRQLAEAISAALTQAKGIQG